MLFRYNSKYTFSNYLNLFKNCLKGIYFKKFEGKVTNSCLMTSNRWWYDKFDWEFCAKKQSLVCKSRSCFLANIQPRPKKYSYLIASSEILCITVAKVRGLGLR